MPPCTTKRRTTTKIKTKINHNYQKIQLYGSLTTKELKKKHLFRLVGRAKTAAWVKKIRGKAAEEGWSKCSSGWWSHIRLRMKWEEQLGRETDCTTQGSSVGKEDLKTSGCKNLWGLPQWDKLSASPESLLERPTGY